MKVTISEDLQQELEGLNGGDMGETLRKALTLYLEASKRTQDGKTKLGFFDSTSLATGSEITGL